MGNQIDSYRMDQHFYCIADELLDAGVVTNTRYSSCGSSDGMSVYVSEFEDGTEKKSSYCFSCSQSFQEAELKLSSIAVEIGLSPDENGVVVKKEFIRKPKATRITREEVQEVISYGTQGKGCRGIKDKYRAFFGHRIKIGNDGKPKVIFYPETRDDGKLCGFKTRTLPKSFGYENKGLTGIKSELAGQFKFKDQHFRDIVICAGEEDMVAFFQQFDEYQERRNAKTGAAYTPMPVVSPTTGEGSAYKQLQAQYDFINRAETIFIGMDADDAGRAAAAEIATLFPKDKVKIINWSLKDPNNAIRHDPKYNPEGKDFSAQTIRDFYDAKDYVNSGVKSSKGLQDSIKEVLLRPRISLPPYMDGISKMMGGESGESGMLQGVIMNLIGDTSVGKSTHVNGMAHHFFMTSPIKPIVASLEATAGQYALDVISIHLGENVKKGRTGQEVLDYIETPEVQLRLKDLWENEHGEERFQIIDEREGDLKNLEKQLERSFYKSGCKLFIIDVLTDVVRNLSNEAQADHMAWQKIMVKNGATIINVMHTKKPTRSSDGSLNRISEYDILGSGTFPQSAAINILIDRDKMAECSIEKNTTRVRMPKCRDGNTGDAGEWLYDVVTRKVYDRDKFFKDNPDKLPEGYDLKANPHSQEEKGKFGKKAGGGKKKDNAPVDDLYSDGVIV